jgi:hypothetical protein
MELNKNKKIIISFNSKAFKKYCEECYNLCFDKHQGYGPGNINRFKLEGLTMRMWEKIERAYGIVWEKRDPKGENLENVFKDIHNYAVIALMYMKKEWY